MAVNSFLLAQITIAQATEIYSRFYQVDQEQMDNFKRCCDAFDYLIESFHGKDECTLEVDVADDDLTVKVTLTLPGAIPEDGTPPDFSWITDWALSMETNSMADGRVQLSFVFPSLWEEIL